MPDNDNPIHPVTQPPISTSGNSGYKPSASNPPVVKSSPITQGGGYYQSRATDLGLMEQSPQAKKLPEMSVRLGEAKPGDKMVGGSTGNTMLNKSLTNQMNGMGPLSSSEAQFGTGGIFKKPNASSYESGSSLTSTIPNIMADNNVQSAIGSVTQPVSTGIMRSVPQIKTASFTAPQVDLMEQFKGGLDSI
jgi:hypothetical protein